MTRLPSCNLCSALKRAMAIAPVIALVWAAPCQATGPIADLTFRVLLLSGQETLTLSADADVRVSDASTPGTRTWNAGKYSLRQERAGAQPDRQVFRVFTKTFPLNKRDEAEAYLREWRARGYEPEIIERGKRIPTAAGPQLDTRIYWISMARCATLAEVDAVQARLTRDGGPGWVRPETVQEGTARVRVKNAAGQEVALLQTPIRIEGSVVTVQERENRRYAGALEIGVDPAGKLDLIEEVSLETYVACVLPAEMPALWPVEALKAQSVAARTEILAHFGLKHEPEGYSFTDTELSRAYAGIGPRHPNSDAAVQATRGRVLLSGVRLAPAVFSATCGGWTEDNDTVWSAPPDSTLRGKADAAPGQLYRPDGKTISQWLRSKPDAYCRGDEQYFRWRRSYPASELSRIVNKRHDVGAIRSISLGERGASGRLKRVTIEGSKGKAVVEKELPIRLAFGGLPSAMFILDAEKSASGTRYTFVGGGRGHGVGLCQNGAKAMAAAGKRYEEILAHYFSGIHIETIQ